MKKPKNNSESSSVKINHIGTTEDTLSSRGGLTLFVKYLHTIKLGSHLEQAFGFLQKSRKSQAVSEIFKQLFCFLLDGSSRHLAYFDQLKHDQGYAAGIESRQKQLLSSDSIKRFFRKILLPHAWTFRKLLQTFFLWRLKITQPDILIFGIDTMVMDNDEAEQRQGVKPTYKKVKGYQPLQMTWGSYIVDAIFRSGEKHSNYSDHVPKMIQRMVALVREHYRRDIPIIFCMDSGFCDQKIYTCCEALDVAYISGGKMHQDIQETVRALPKAQWGRLHKENQTWRYVDFEDKRGTWKQTRRAVFCQPVYERRQELLEFARPDTILYTNLGRSEKLDELLKQSGHESLLTTENIVATYHARGADELVHRALKDFADQRLPFKKFHQNMGYYYTIVLAFFVYESFKQDVGAEVIPITAYATTVRRRLIDIAAKLVRHADRITLKVTQAVWDRLHLDRLWARCFEAPALPTVT